MLVVYYLLTVVPVVMSQYMLLVTTEILTKRRLSWPRKALVTFLVSLVFFGITLILMPLIGIGLPVFIVNCLTMLLIIMGFNYRNMSRQNRFHLIIATGLSVVLYYFATYLADVACFYLSTGDQSGRMFLTLTGPATLLVQAIIVLLLKFKNPYDFFQQLVSNGVVEALAIAVVFLNLIMISVSQYYLTDVLMILATTEVTPRLLSKLFILIVLILVDVLISGILIGISSYILFQIRQRKMQENIVLQQNFYIQNLEKMQQDMRVMRHDYKNILSGLVLQVQAGDIEGIKAFMESTVTQFDQQIGKSIQQTTHLSKVELIELKGLLLMKLAEMEDLNIQCSLEILTPVTDIKMDTIDLLRCVGILLDNAREELVSSLDKELKIVISQEEQDVSIIVKNRVKQIPLLQQIWQEGYSTKGENRGLGLFSYQRIVDKYPNVLKETKCDQRYFVQILKIRYA